MSATELIKQLQDVKPEGLGEEERKGLMAACDQAKSTLENPFEAGIRICFAVSVSTLLKSTKEADERIGS